MPDSIRVLSTNGPMLSSAYLDRTPKGPQFGTLVFYTSLTACSTHYGVCEAFTWQMLTAGSSSHCRTEMTRTRYVRILLRSRCKIHEARLTGCWRSALEHSRPDSGTCLLLERQVAPVLSGDCHQPRHPVGNARQHACPAHDGDRHRQDGAASHVRPRFFFINVWRRRATLRRRKEAQPFVQQATNDQCPVQEPIELFASRFGQ